MSASLTSQHPHVNATNLRYTCYEKKKMPYVEGGNGTKKYNIGCTIKYFYSDIPNQKKTLSVVYPAARKVMYKKI